MSRGSRRGWPLAWSTASSALVLALTACGGTEPEPEPPPRLAADTGALFIRETAEVREAIAAGHPAVARGEALELRELVRDAIGRGDVPADLRRPLVRAVNRLVASIEVPPPAPPSPTPTPTPPPATPPAGDACAALEGEQAVLEGQKDALEKDDPAREAIEEQLKALKDELKACKKGNGGEEDEGEGDGDGDD